MIAKHKILTILPCVLLLVSSLYAYSSAGWNINEEGKLEMIGRVDFIKCGLDYFSLCIVLWLAYRSINRIHISRELTLALPLLLFAVIFWIIMTIAEHGLMTMIYTPGSPLSYLAILAIYVGADEECWNIIKRIAPIFASIYLTLATIPYLELKVLGDFSNLAGNNPIIYFMTTSFWWASISSIEISHKSIYYKLWIVLLIAIFAFLAFSMALRSWLIQSVLLLMLVIWQFHSSKWLRIIFVVVLMAGVLWSAEQIVTSSEMQEEVDAFNDKLTKDNRTHQYEILFEEISLDQWILGGGMKASYAINGEGNYKHIDNQYMLLLFRYGILLAIPWISIWLLTLFKKRERDKKYIYDRSAVYVVVLWLMALGGLSVYNAVIVNPQNILLAMVAGRVLYQKVIS